MESAVEPSSSPPPLLEEESLWERFPPPSPALPPGLGLEPTFGAMRPVPTPPTPFAPEQSAPLEICGKTELFLHNIVEDKRWRVCEQL